MELADKIQIINDVFESNNLPSQKYKNACLEVINKYQEAINFTDSCTAERTGKGKIVLNYDEFKEKWFDKKEGIIYVDKLTTEIVDVNFILNTYQEYCNRL